MRRTPALQDVLAYRNDALVKTMSKKHGLPIHECQELFIDLKKWIWLIGTRDERPFAFPCFQEQWVLDGFWHEFILSTREYTDFCTYYFGHYIHHKPAPDDVQGAGATLIRQDLEHFIDINKGLLEEAMLEVQQKLGREVVIRWYRDIPRQYPLLT
ncbi:MULTISPECIES: hypothetical protein [unclassified Pseudomonas]|uniref:hypothetical protein n=1 Tax=unclassified Pseudomonas TaxID=196821 RepID=UPI000A1E3A69|nr:MULTISPECIES: hypothetical protein [unclassified Pseudomonas]POA51839.1 hypothetical protein C1889_25625 [Pseudomonas sp. FW507-12TSA]UMZ09812.1 hypothetical protein I9018_20135 [Pseudomonas sp. MPFS]